ncbi:hypothetical protein KP509_17G013400 [Ceratopteris richardii]|uniref:Uncharacterized protein n=1 Tax=Ceratopteris richardii TaxID=49495 RepID=A0A8T2SS93_CERRI|nr:hypothetical protein KP509_17G013400 [Ceratopteris richardii]
MLKSIRTKGYVQSRCISSKLCWYVCMFVGHAFALHILIIGVRHDDEQKDVLVKRVLQPLEKLNRISVKLGLCSCCMYVEKYTHQGLCAVEMHIFQIMLVRLYVRMSSTSCT